MTDAPLSLVFERPDGARGEHPIDSGQWADVVRVFEQLRAVVPADAVWFVHVHHRRQRSAVPKTASGPMEGSIVADTATAPPSWAQALLDHAPV